MCFIGSKSCSLLEWTDARIVEGGSKHLVCVPVICASICQSVIMD